MKISEYICDKGAAIGIGLLAGLASGVFLVFMEIELPIVVVVEVIYLMGFFGTLAYDFFRRKQY